MSAAAAWAAAFQAGLALHRAGRPAEALERYREAMAADPGRADAWTNAGIALVQLERGAEAVTCLERAADLAPGNAPVRLNLGSALLRLGRADAAAAAFDAALRRDPTLAGAASGLADALLALGRRGEALEPLTRAIALGLDGPAERLKQAALLREAGRPGDAFETLQVASGQAPDHAEVLAAMGALLLDFGQAADALAYLAQARALGLRTATLECNRALALEQLGRLSEAVLGQDQALAADPGLLPAWLALGRVLLTLRMARPAVEAFAGALALAPDDAAARLGKAEAQAALAAGGWFNPALANGMEQVFDLMTYRCDWEDFAARHDALLLEVQRDPLVLPPFSLLGLVDDPGLQRHVADAHAGRLATRPAPAVAAPGGRIRLGYFSGDFHTHATMALMAELFEAHDATRFERFAFSYGPSFGDEGRARAEAGFDHFLDVGALADAEVADLARAHGIDIAVDLKGWTGGGRPGIFAARAAALQIAYLGYPGTTGGTFMDYAVVDPVTAPDGADADWSEALIRLPRCYQANRGPLAWDVVPATRAEAGLPHGALVFCCFNQVYKILPETFARWMAILRAVPDSLLWLWADTPVPRANLRAEAERLGVAGTRLLFAQTLARPQHLARMAAADLMLDTWPVNAHTTASDALRVGLPVLTLPGRSFVSRVAASLLVTAGAPELVAADAAGYVARAVALGSDRDRLQVLRRRLHEGRMTSPLFEPSRLARELEQAYVIGLERQRAGLPPAAMSL